MNNDPDTRERLLDAAQKLFVEQGMDATSLRHITTLAGANLASVNYHFGSKNELIQALFARQLDPLNKERIRLLDEFEKRFATNPVPLELILEAFFKPAFARLQNEKSRDFVCLLGRILSDANDLRRTLLSQFKEVQVRFFAALHKTLPDIPVTDLTWRAHFMIGAMAHTFALPERLSIPSPETMYDTNDTEIMQRLIEFAAAGLSAPTSATQNGDLNK